LHSFFGARVDVKPRRSLSEISLEVFYGQVGTVGDLEFGGCRNPSIAPSENPFYVFPALPDLACVPPFEWFQFACDTSLVQEVVVHEVPHSNPSLVNTYPEFKR
jgi:hypothetical protein